MASGGEARLFTALPEQAAPKRVGCGLPRLRCAERDQLEWRPVSLDGLLAEDHRVRLVWGFVEGLDLTPLLWHLSRRWPVDRVTRQRTRAFCWLFGCMPRWRGSAAPARLPAAVRSTSHSSGSVAGWG